MRKRSGICAQERDIEKSIIDYLTIRQIFAWKAKTVGTWDPENGCFRRASKRYMRGVADILGIYKGKPIAIEIKSGNGRLSPEQKIFLERFAQEGGIAMCVYGVEELAEMLDSLDNNAKHVPAVTSGGQDLVAGAIRE